MYFLIRVIGCLAMVILFAGSAIAGDIRAGFGFQDVQIGDAGGVKEK